MPSSRISSPFGASKLNIPSATYYHFIDTTVMERRSLPKEVSTMFEVHVEEWLQLYRKEKHGRPIPERVDNPFDQTKIKTFNFTLPFGNIPAGREGFQLARMRIDFGLLTGLHGIDQGLCNYLTKDIVLAAFKEAQRKRTRDDQWLKIEIQVKVVKIVLLPWHGPKRMEIDG